ncbi:T9SS type A sorting domain-containing protein [Algibacter mikhailovii]|uniref:F5/8 type C domain-containing protein n=1 Tax=Algibacter mikhailovii TaxID=425498 RepID=A0A918V6S4_9FLAO|nr:T9SS type A sorting domain-containing protein [Algibacter mikhailovii]GGZ75251.1 hypothetical protein GCM10007028_10920 [Algibacter mikhailovii]
MRTKLHSKNFKQKNTYLAFALCLVSLFTFAQDPVDTSNTEITGVSVNFYFDQQVDIPAGKENYAANAVDNDPDTDWAAESSDPRGEALILDLGGGYDLAEIQYLTVTKSPSYQFQLWVSTTGVEEADFTNIYPSAGNLLTNQDNTYLQFKDFTPIAGAKYVKVKCYGRSDSPWNTLSEIKFYSTATASVKDNELSGFTLSPNPANSFFTLSNLNNKVNNVQILSLEGKLISSQSFDGFSKKLTIDTANLANGVYVVKLSDAAKSLNASKLMVIQH